MIFDLSDPMTMVIIEALGNHPYKEAAPVIGELQRQINSQRPPVQSNGKVEHIAEKNG